MKKTTRFEYGFGGLENIKKGNLNALETIRNIEIAEFMGSTTPSGIIIPKFVGVYQIEETIPETYEEEVNMGKIEKMNELFNKMINTYFKFSLELYGEEEVFDPHLIHVCYDSKFYSEKLTRECLGKGSGRLGVTSYSGYPNFKEKNTNIALEAIKALSKARNEQGLTRITEEMYAKMQQYLEKFGLTRHEKAIIDTLKSIENYDEERLSMLLSTLSSLNLSEDQS